MLDTVRARLLWEEGGIVAAYAVPAEDVIPGTPGVRPLPELPGFVATDWPVFDVWLEEDEEVVGHPRDPYHRIDARRSSRPVRVLVDDEVVAASDRPVLLFETDLPVRAYLPRADVRADLLKASGTVTVCAYKGRATYWDVAGVRDLAWTYADPLDGAAAIAGLVCFLNERCDVELDGEALGRPRTQWSGGVRSNERGGPSGEN